jgi:hypothetical protein
MRRMSGVLTAFAATVVAMVMALPVDARGIEPGAGGATATIKGKVLKEDGSVAAGVVVRVMHAPAKAGGPDKSPKAREPGGGAGGGAGGGGGGEAPKKEHKAPPVAETTTDANGEFVVSVPPGEYLVVVGKRGEASGRAPVKATEGATVTVNIQLKAPQAGEKGKGK